MSDADPDLGLPADILAWAAGTLGCAIVAVERVIGGASRASAILTCDDGRRAFLRRETGTGPLAGTPFTLARECSILDALGGSGVPAPAVIGYSAACDALLMEVVPGFTSYQRTLPEAEEAVLRRELIAAIVALQALDPAGAPGIALGPARTIGEALATDLAVWTSLYHERVADRDPLIDYALAWLARGAPDADQPPVIVHGDIGPGNFLIDGGHVAALIDWEMVRIGHPLEDLACVIARALGAPFGSEDEHIANYQAASGRAVDPAALDYALVLVLVRWMIAISIALSRPDAAQNVPMLLAFRQIDGRSMLASLLRGEGLAPASAPPVELTPRRATRAAHAWCRAVVGDYAGSARLDAADRYRLAGAGELLAYLDAFDRYGADRYEQEEVARIEALLGRPFAGHDEAKRALCDRIAEGADGALLRHVEWRTLRDHAIMRELMGARADNVVALTYPPGERR